MDDFWVKWQAYSLTFREKLVFLGTFCILVAVEESLKWTISG